MCLTASFAIGTLHGVLVGGLVSMSVKDNPKRIAVLGLELASDVLLSGVLMR